MDEEEKKRAKAVADGIRAQEAREANSGLIAVLGLALSVGICIFTAKILWGLVVFVLFFWVARRLYWK